ncbi:MAG: polysaccharide pyruvyl transferase family protein [Lachnospiraceae bacterium]|nr:polysaccharide pyruvyl transferase family protein [Lachnospiraceae bacterium]
MKIGLITIHHAYNFGASLQSHATYRTLSKLGHEVEFIDYDNNTFLSERQLFLSFNNLGNILRNIRTLFQLNQLKTRIHKFETFYNKYLISPSHYINNIDWDTTRYNVILTGSDQTFNLYLTNNPQEMRPFFLENISDKKKVTYASSMGEKFFKLTNSDEQWMKEQFLKFNSLSVREKKSADFIEQLTGVRPQVVLDPTLLLSADEWNKEVIKSNYEKGEYIAFYTVLSDSWVIKYIEKLSSITRLRVVALHQRTRYELGTKFEYAGDIGPGEFLSIIKNAKYVVTTSFHATCFSIIFKKQFVSLIIGEGNRLKSLLSSVGLADRIVTSNSVKEYERVLQNIDFDNSHKMWQEEKNISMAYLENALK